MKIKVYIAGKITGDPDYKEKFEAAAKELEEEGYVVLSPAILPGGLSAAEYMRICFAMIDTADVVKFLPGYKESAGALVELQYCFYIDKQVVLPEYRENDIDLLTNDNDRM